MSSDTDYHNYLQKIFPGTTWRIEKINGGFVNITVRAVKTSGHATAESFILKHARSQFGEPGEMQDFSLQRQASVVAIAN